MKAGKILVVLAIAAVVVAFFALGGNRYLTFEAIKAQQAAIAGYYQANQGQTIALFFAGYVAVTALSLPGAALMTLLAGAIIGLWTGVIIVSFASSIGATLCADGMSRPKECRGNRSRESSDGSRPSSNWDVVS